jgi:phosphoglycolate phosphatase
LITTLPSSRINQKFFRALPPLNRRIETVIRFRTVLFDLDGTILDHFAAIHRTHAQTLQHFGLPAPTLEAVRHSVGGGLETAVAQLLGPDHANQLDEAIATYRSLWPANLLYQAKLLPGTIDLLTNLKSRGVKCAVFTNKHGPSARSVLEHLQVTGLLDGVFGAFDTPYLKPQVEFANFVLESLGATADSTCLVGDSPFDIEAAHNASFPAFCVATGTHTVTQLQAAGADGVYPDLTTLGREALGV